MAVIDPIKLVIENYPEGKIESLSAPIHPQNEEMGTREIFSVGIYTLIKKILMKKRRIINISV